MLCGSPHGQGHDCVSGFLCSAGVSSQGTFLVGYSALHIRKSADRNRSIFPFPVLNFGFACCHSPGESGHRRGESRRSYSIHPWEFVNIQMTGLFAGGGPSWGMARRTVK